MERRTKAAGQQWGTLGYMVGEVWKGADEIRAQAYGPSDNPALAAAVGRGGPVVPVYVLDDAAEGNWPMGGAGRWWLHHSLESLGRDLAEMGSRIVFRRGDAAQEIAKIAMEVGAKTVHAVRHYEPWWRAAQGRLAKEVDLVLHDGNYLLPIGAVTTGAGDPYKIYTPFSKAVLAQMPVVMH